MSMNKACFAGIVLSVAVWAQGSTAPPFSYEGANGPAHWGDLSPQYSTCKTGKEQSPVDIRNAKSAALPPLHFDYKPVPLRLINNGHTVQADYAAGSFLSVGGDRYELRQVHFHHPSEERINGRAFDMVVHLVHANSQGATAVVSILIEPGAANSAIQKIFSAVPRVDGQDHEIPGVQINASDFLPANESYYTYRGSLTTPPCTEGVTWFILKTPVNASTEQIHVFSSMFPSNVRPLQPLGGRIISGSRML